MSPTKHGATPVAVLALVATVVIWASFLVMTRAAVTARLGPLEVGLLRFGIGGLLFLPVLLLRPGGIAGGPWHRARMLDILAIPLFGGVGFLLLLANGLRYAPAADSGVFAPGMLPLYVAVLSAVLLGERFTRLRQLGFSLIVLGALIFGGIAALSGSAPGAWKGHLMFTGASMCWAVYTISYRRSGLDAVTAGGLMCLGTAAVFVVMALFQGVDFSALTLPMFLVQFFFQGILSGFAATFTYFYAVTHVGASKSAACAALVPVLAAVGAWLYLGEPIGPVKAAGILVVAAGVALASGAFTFGKRVGKHAPHGI